MDRAGLGYVRRENCFVRLEDVGAAQRLMDQQLRVNWQKKLEARLRRFHPAHAQLFPTCPVGYYWSVDASEWASDVMFRSSRALAQLYPRLIQHGMRHLASREVMRFLGRRVPAHGGINAQFAGEVVSDLRERPEGLRIKHRLNRNTVKMYDKQGSVLRVETTLNNSRDMRVFRSKEGEPNGPRTWRILRKAVADVPRRAQVCQAANERYLESLAAVSESSTTLAMLTRRVCRPTRWKGRQVRALNPLAPEDAQLLAAVNRGEYAINGFRNRDLRALLYGQDADPITRRRHAAAVTRKLRLLRAHGLIRKVPKTHRYTLSKKGTQVITALLAARAADTTKLMDAA
jgi:hypothetical protein